MQPQAVEQRRKGRPVLIGTLSVLSLAVIAAGLWLSHLMLLKPVITSQYQDEYIALVESLQPEPTAENGWELFVEAGVIAATAEREAEAAHASTESDDDALDRLESSFDLSSESLARDEAMRAAIAADTVARAERAGLPAVLDQLAAARRMVPEGDYPLSLDPEAMSVEESSSARRLARITTARLVAAAQRDDHAEMMRSLDHSLAVANAASARKVIFSALVETACLSLTVDALTQALMGHPMPDATLTAIDARLRDIDARSRLVVAFQGERLFTLHQVQRNFSDDGDGDGFLLDGREKNLFAPPPTSGSASVTGRIAGRFRAGRRETTDRLEAEFAARIAVLQVHRSEGSSVPVPPPLPYSNYWAYIEATMVLSPSIISLAYGTEAQVAGLRTLIAIQRYELAHGTPPDSLGALVPDFLPSLLVDPFAATPTEPFRYRRLDTPDEHGRTYLLYSVGAETGDNQGQQHPTSRLAALRNGPDGTAHSDYVINHLDSDSD